MSKIAAAYKEYQKRLKLADAMDFDDIIVNTVELFETCPDVLGYYQNKFRYIMLSISLFHFLPESTEIFASSAMMIRAYTVSEEQR